MEAIELRQTMAQLGMSSAEFARRAHVAEKSVNRWRDPELPWNVPQDIIDKVLTPWLERQEQAVEVALEIVEDATAEHGEPDKIYLPWYCTREELLEAHPRDGRTVDMANATALRLSAALEALGYEVEFVAPGDVQTPIL